MAKIRPVTIAPGVVVGGPLPVLIMGPCVIESERHALTMAGLVQAAAARIGFPVIFKASYDKANRTSSASFRGPGLEAGLAVLAKVRKELGVPLSNDIHSEWVCPTSSTA